MAAAPLALVILAAGASTRLGEPKALARLGDDPDDTPLARLASAGAELGAGPARIVVGADGARLRARASGGVLWIENPDWSLGRTGSVLAAQRALPGHDLCLAPVDVPRVGAAVFGALGEAWRNAGSPPEGWLAPRCSTPEGARFGHPVVLGRALLARLAADPEVWRARPLRALRAHAHPLLAVDTDDAAVLEDLDTPADLRRLRAPRNGGPENTSGSR